MCLLVPAAVLPLPRATMDYPSQRIPARPGGKSQAEEADGVLHPTSPGPDVSAVRAPERPRPSNGRAKASDRDIATFVESLDAAQYLLRSIADAVLSDLGGGITATQLRL